MYVVMPEILAKENVAKNTHSAHRSVCVKARLFCLKSNAGTLSPLAFTSLLFDYS